MDSLIFLIFTPRRRSDTKEKNMNKKDITSIHKQIQSAIKDGKLKMRSKRYFIARTILIIIGIVIISVALVYLMSFVFFVLHITGAWELSSFGLKGFGLFIFSLPWLLLSATFVFLIGLELLIKKTTIAYRKPLAYSVLGMSVLVLLAGFGFARLPLHEMMYQRAVEDNISPVMRSFYKEFGQRSLYNAHPGVIIEMNDDGFVMNTHMNMLMNVLINDKTNIIDNRVLKINDNVMVIGEYKDGSITAEAIKIRRGGRGLLDSHSHFLMHR